MGRGRDNPVAAFDFDALAPGSCEIQRAALAGLGAIDIMAMHLHSPHPRQMPGR